MLSCDFPRHSTLTKCKEHITIGLVNNMPDAALRNTECQFHELLFAAGHDFAIELRCFSLPELPRNPAGQLHVAQYYENIAELWSSNLDGLIVTGTEPRALELANEPYWGTITRLIDWAEEHTVSAIWSCLAAHAVVLHKDGIARVRLANKLCGVFDCFRDTEHEIMTGVSSSLRIPHSRYNGLPEQSLISHGYQVLSRSPVAGVDIFAKPSGSLFFFFQGHPEYDSGALLREYKRDVRRYLAGEMNTYPEVPEGILDAEADGLLSGLRQRAQQDRAADVLREVGTVLSEASFDHPWREAAVCIYRNWLSYLAKRRHRETQELSASALMAPCLPRRPGHADQSLRLASL